MEPDVLRQIFEYSQGRNWERLSLLTESTWTNKLFRKWKKLLIEGDRYFTDIADRLDGSELLLWLQDKDMNWQVKVPLHTNHGTLMTTLDYPKNHPEGIRIIGHVCANRGHLKVLDWLICTHRLTKQNIIGRCEMFEGAALNGRLEVVQWLVERFQIQKQDVFYPTNLALQYAAECGHLEIITWLIERLGLGT